MVSIHFLRGGGRNFIPNREGGEIKRAETRGSNYDRERGWSSWGSRGATSPQPMHRAAIGGQSEIRCNFRPHFTTECLIIMCMSCSINNANTY